jgi:hypothetical protein
MFTFLDMGSGTLQIFTLHGSLIHGIPQTCHMLHVFFLRRATFHRLPTEVSSGDGGRYIQPLS